MSTRQKLFKKEGRYLHNINIPKIDASFSYEKKTEMVSSILSELPTNGITLQRKKDTFLRTASEKIITFSKNIPTEKYIISGISAAFILVSTITIKSTLIPSRYLAKDNANYHIYSSTPLTYDTYTSILSTKNSRSEKIDGVFNYYKCPLEGLGSKFVEEADKNDIPWWLVASVAFKESSCGKNTPKVDGQESYNAWGWGVYGNNVQMFVNFARGIEVVSNYFNQNFYSAGITDLCEIMKIYTPPSDGSWCKDVAHFAEVFEDFEQR